MITAAAAAIREGICDYTDTFEATVEFAVVELLNDFGPLVLSSKLVTEFMQHGFWVGLNMRGCLWTPFKSPNNSLPIKVAWLQIEWEDSNEEGYSTYLYCPKTGKFEYEDGGSYSEPKAICDCGRREANHLSGLCNLCTSGV